MKLWLPVTFYDDHADRELASGEVIKRTTHRVLIEATKNDLNELLSDAEYYSNRFGPLGNIAQDFEGDAYYYSLKRSAKRTAEIIRKARHE